MSSFKPGKIERVAGPVIVAGDMLGAQMYEVVRVGDQGLIGEIIKIEQDRATVQVYEETAGIRPGEKVERSGKPLSVELGPGITGQIYDGIQRPLTILFEKTGPFVRRGLTLPPIDKGKKWHFVPTTKSHATVTAGDIIGHVKETSLITQQIMIPQNLSGKITSIVNEGDYTIGEPVGELDSPGGPVPLFMLNTWPVRTARGFKRKLPSNTPLLTGQRIIDFFFPIAKGGTATIPGAFGTGKTMAQQQLAKWADASVIVYVGCGERGNEMAEVLETFPKLVDPRSGEPIMNRTVLIANTSNMPIAAREASVYTGITIAEYDWYMKEIDPDWTMMRKEAMHLLQRDDELREIVMLVGTDALSESHRVSLETARMIKEDFLMQAAYNPADTYCDKIKTDLMIKLILDYHKIMQKAVDENIPLQKILDLPVKIEIDRMRLTAADNFPSFAEHIEEELNKDYKSIGGK